MRNEFYYKISNIVQKFDSEKFAAWMQNVFKDSAFKKQIELVKAVKSNPATISRLMTGKAQTPDGMPSQPDKELIIRLAEVFKCDVNDVLVLAGYAPNEQIKDKRFAHLMRTIENLEPEKRENTYRIMKEVVKSQNPNANFNYIDEE